MSAAEDDTDSELNFGFVSKKGREESSNGAEPRKKKKRTAYEVEREAKAAAVLASLQARPPTAANPRLHAASPTIEQNADGGAYQEVGDGETNADDSHRTEPRPQLDPEVRARINRSRNYHLTVNALMEVDPSTKRLMQMNVAPGTAAGGGVPQYRSTNRLLSNSTAYQPFNRGRGRGRGDGGGGGGEGGGYRGGGGRGTPLGLGWGGRGRGGGRGGYPRQPYQQQPRGGYSGPQSYPKRPRE